MTTTHVRTIASSSARDQRAPARGSAPMILAAIALGGLAFGIRLTVLLANGGLLGSSAYDDGVYYASAAAFVHGRWPYADFLLLQPPAIVVAGAPFAALGAVAGDPVGVVAARLTWIGIGAAGCVLVAVLAGRRSTAAGLIAGAFAACFFPMAYGERSMLLEPPATVLLLVAVLLLRRGTAKATLLAGILAGLTVDLKIWNLVPVLVLAASARGRLRFLSGAIGSASLLAAPFLLRAPEAMVRQVLLDQLGRPRLPDDGVWRRLITITGAQYAFDATGASTTAVMIVAVGAVLLIGAAAVAAWRVPGGRQAVVLLVACLAVLLGSPSFFTHYVAYTGPWTALVLGLGGGAVVSRLPLSGLRSGGAALLALAVASPTLGFTLAPGAPVVPLQPLAAAARRVDGCVRSDDPGLLAALGVLSRDLDRGCVLWPDVSGMTYDDPDLPTVAADRSGSVRWQRVAMRYLLGGDAVIVARTGTGLSEPNLHAVAGLPALARSRGLTLHATAALGAGPPS